MNESPMQTTRKAGCGCALDTALLLNRLALGAFFLLAGLGKLRMGVGKFYSEGFTGLRPAWLPEAFAWPFGHALPFIEFAVGGLLVIGLLGRLTAATIALLLLSFCIALHQAGMLFQGPGPFNVDIILLTLSVLLAATGPGRFSVDGWRRASGRPLGAAAAGSSREDMAG